MPERTYSSSLDPENNHDLDFATDNEDIDFEADIVSNQHKRLEEVLIEAPLFIWDEGLSNHKHCLSTAFSICNYSRNKVLVIMGDWRQCPRQRTVCAEEIVVLAAEVKAIVVYMCLTSAPTFTNAMLIIW